MYGLVLEIAALSVCVFCLANYLRNHTGHEKVSLKNLSDKLKETRTLYFWLIICLFLSSAFDVIDFIIENYVADRSAFSVDMLCEFYFLVHTCLPPLFVLSIISITDAFAEKSSRFFAFFFVPFFIEEAIIITNPLSRLTVCVLTAFMDAPNWQANRL